MFAEQSESDNRVFLKVLENCHEKISGVSKFLGAWLVIMIALFILIEYELQDRTSKVQEIEDQVDEQEVNLQDKVQGIVDLIPETFSQRKKLAKAIKAIARTTQRHNEVKTNFEARNKNNKRIALLDEKHKIAKSNQSPSRTKETDKSDAVSMIDKKIESLKKEQEVAIISRTDLIVERKAKYGVEKKEIKSQVLDAEETLSNLSAEISALEKIKQDLVTLGFKAEEAEKKIQSLNDDKKKLAAKDKSIPTPFGAFDIHPRFGLLLLLLSSVVIYIVFSAGRVEVNSFLINLSLLGSAQEGKQRLPFWLFPLDSRLPPEWRKEYGKITAGVTLEVGWLVMNLLIIHQYKVWKSMGPGWLDSFRGIELALWLLISIHVLLAGRHLLGNPFHLRLKAALPGSRRFHINSTRRRVIFGIITTAGLATGWTFRSMLRQSISSATTGIKLQGAVLESRLVVNSATGIAHDIHICARHLPARRNRTREVGEISLNQFHKSYAPRILESLAKSLLKKDDLKNSVEYLELAIRKAPERLHLYDYLIGIYGRQKRYDKIYELLNSACRGFQKQLEVTTVTSRRRGRLEKSLIELQKRIRYAQARAENAKVRGSKSFVEASLC